MGVGTIIENDRSGYAIETFDLTRKFGELTAVDHVSIKVNRGEILGFLGPNGAGKSTTIRMLCTLLRPTEGSAKVAGHDIVKEASHVREHIGLVSEKMIMYDRLTAYENMKLFGKMYNLPREEMEKRIDELLEVVDMTKWRDHRIGTFSTGMKQRINVIRALIHRPEILFLDEPTLGLDPQSTAEIRTLTKQINTQFDTTIMLTTHMMVEADMLCDRVAIIDYGKIVALDTPTGLKRSVSGNNIASIELTIPNLSPRILKAIQAESCVKSLMQEENTRLTVRATCKEGLDDVIDAVRKEGGKIWGAKTLDPTLEDVFLKLTGHEVREEVSNKVKGPPRRHGPHGRRVKSRVR